MIKTNVSYKIILLIIITGLFFSISPPPAEALFTITTEEEVELGRMASEEMEDEYGLSYEDYDWVNEVGEKLIQISPRAGIEYEFNVVDMYEPNAFAFPGGFIYITRGMLDDFVRGDEDVLAFILAHELGHVDKRHGITQFEIQSDVDELLSVLFQENEPVLDMAQLLSAFMFLKYTRDQEIEADTYGMTVAKDAGYNPKAAVDFFKDLKVYEDSNYEYVPEFLASHPDTFWRIEWAKMYYTLLTGQLYMD